MPREVRVIVFDRHEIGVALYDYLVRRREISDEDRVAVREIAERHRLTVTVELSSNRGKRVETVETPRVAAALMNYCIKRKIPLPRDTDKALRHVTSGIAFTFNSGIRPEDVEFVFHEREASAA